MSNSKPSLVDRITSMFRGDTEPPERALRTLREQVHDWAVELKPEQDGDPNVRSLRDALKGFLTATEGTTVDADPFGLPAEEFGNLLAQTQEVRSATPEPNPVSLDTLARLAMQSLPFEDRRRVVVKSSKSFDAVLDPSVAALSIESLFRYMLTLTTSREILISFSESGGITRMNCEMMSGRRESGARNIAVRDATSDLLLAISRLNVALLGGSLDKETTRRGTAIRLEINTNS